MKNGLVHLYFGKGKGKTTAAMGLALRALQAGWKVVILQFLKSGSSGEIELLEELGAEIYRGKEGKSFVFQMSEEEKTRTRQMQTAHLAQAMARQADLLILDEACAAWQLDMVDRDLLRKAVLERPGGQEVVLTGREPADWMTEAADYCTEMVCHRHPYEKGVSARKGVEY